MLLLEAFNQVEEEMKGEKTLNSDQLLAKGIMITEEKTGRLFDKKK